MAEALLRHEAGDRFEALSAGTRPAGVVQPLALFRRKAALRTDEEADRLRPLRQSAQAVCETVRALRLIRHEQQSGRTRKRLLERQRRIDGRQPPAAALFGGLDDEAQPALGPPP